MYYIIIMPSFAAGKLISLLSSLYHYFRYLSAKPHLAGTEENNEIGNWIEQKWKDYGFETFRETYNVLLSYPGNETNRNKVQMALDLPGKCHSADHISLFSND